MNSTEAGNIGEMLVCEWFRANGYYYEHNTKLPGATDIQAGKTTSVKTLRYLVQVKTAIYPNTPDVLSVDERSKIKARAQRNACTPFLAQVVINSSGQQIGKIEWTNLE